MLEHVCYEPFSLKIWKSLEDILCQLVEFCVLSEIDVSKTRFKEINENLRRSCTHVLRTCVQIFIPLAS